MDIKAGELFNVVICNTFKLHVRLMLCTERNLKFNFHFIQKVYPYCACTCTLCQSVFVPIIALN